MAETTTRRRGNPAGIASLVFGVLLILAGIIAQTVSPAIPAILEQTGLSFDAIPFLISLPQAIIATIATVLGIIGLLLHDRARVPAIIGTALGASHLIVGVAGIVGAQLVTATLS